MNEQLAATIENQYDHLKNTSRLVDTHHEPSPGIVLIIEGTRVQGVLIRVQTASSVSLSRSKCLRALA